MTLTEGDDVPQALVLDRPNKPLRVGVEVRVVSQTRSPGGTSRRRVRQRAQEQLVLGRRVPDPKVVPVDTAHVSEHLDAPQVAIREDRHVAELWELGRSRQ
jgi:hypothetical protein